MTAPAGIPALSAASPETSFKMRAPTPVKVVSKFTPRKGREDLPVAMISSITRLASLIGIEKPSPMEPDELAPRDAIAELIPTTAPVESTSGPPEFPGLIAASV